jgi:hypothetical protein
MVFLYFNFTSPFQLLLISCILSGFGIMEYPDGKKYQGMFESGKREGFGVLASDSETFEGNWKEDQRNGWGFLLDADSNRHEGTWLVSCYFPLLFIPLLFLALLTLYHLAL